MKKVISLIVIFLLIMISGCEKVDKGNYQPGTYFSFDEETKYSVVMYVDKEGSIKSLFFDAIHLIDCDDPDIIDDSCKIITKQALGNDYGMKIASPINKEWYEQVESFSNKVILEQDMEWLEFKYRIRNTDGQYEFTKEQPEGQTKKDKAYTDSVAGVTIYVDNLSKLVNDVLNQAKK